MSHGYRAVQWNPQKRRYDVALWIGIVLYLAVFVGSGFAAFPNADETTLLIRALGTAAFLLLHLILSIGPLCRRWPCLLPLLYNRRHMGVSMFVLALAHAALSTIQFHALGDVNPIVSVFTSNGHYDALARFPFQPLGAAALLLLFAMAATSHDFWLAQLTPPVWKALHMGVYVAYALLVMHVALGVLQQETSPIHALLLLVGVAWIVGVHLWAGWREYAGDVEIPSDADHWIDAGPVATIPEKRARIVSVAGERVAVFRHDGCVSALSNTCRHQNGPLGEGCIRDGLVTCPWHGYQYRPQDGQSPPPFNEKVATFDVRIVDGRVQLRDMPNPPGTLVTSARVDGSSP